MAILVRFLFLMGLKTFKEVWYRVFSPMIQGRKGVVVRESYLVVKGSTYKSENKRDIGKGHLVWCRSIFT